MKVIEKNSLLLVLILTKMLVVMEEGMMIRDWNPLVFLLLDMLWNNFLIHVGGICQLMKNNFGSKFQLLLRKLEIFFNDIKYQFFYY